MFSAQGVKPASLLCRPVGADREKREPSGVPMWLNVVPLSTAPVAKRLLGVFVILEQGSVEVKQGSSETLLGVDVWGQEASEPT